MKYNRIKNALKYRTSRFINERRGWKTDRKIVVIESDDWGSIRMPNRETYEKLLRAGFRVDTSTYNKYDSLASSDDLNATFDVLKKYKDINGKNPVITANTCVSNPNFKKIKESNFDEYFYEPFTKSLERVDAASFDLWGQGIKEGLFFPQLHNREHLNVKKWMDYLKEGNKEVRLAFDLGLWGLGPLISKVGNPSFVRAFDEDVYQESQTLAKIISEGCSLFEAIFGFKSKSFIAPNYIWSGLVEKELYLNGVKYIQGTFHQKQFNEKTKSNYLGKRNKYEQIYLIRNVQFEPAGREASGLVSQALMQIEKAFKLNKPAVICTHRVAFIGSIFEENRTKNLKLLNELLRNITKKWPDVEFMHSSELGDLIIGK